MVIWTLEPFSLRSRKVAGSRVPLQGTATEPGAVALSVQGCSLWAHCLWTTTNFSKCEIRLCISEMSLFAGKQCSLHILKKQFPPRHHMEAQGVSDVHGSYRHLLGYQEVHPGCRCQQLSQHFFPAAYEDQRKGRCRDCFRSQKRCPMGGSEGSQEEIRSIATGC